MARKTAAIKTTNQKNKTVTIKAKSKRSVAAKIAVEQKSSIGQAPSLNSVKLEKKYVIGATIIIVLGILLYYFRSFFVAAIVNGQPIPRWQVINQAEKQSGKQALDSLVRDALIEQEAQKQHVTVSDQEINDQIKSIQKNLSKSGQTLDQALAQQNMTRTDLKKLVRLDKLVSKMAGSKVQVSDKDVQDYIDKNKDTLPQNQTDQQLKASVKTQLSQQKLNEAVQTWLAGLQKNAHVTYFVQYQ